MIKAVIFDCFGVLTEDGWLAFCNKYKTADNEEELRYANHQADRGIIRYEEFLSIVCKLTGAPREEAHKTITTTHHPNEPLFEYIIRLKAGGYKLGVISNVGAELNNFIPQKYVDLFDEITLSYHVNAIKPEPVIYEAHLSQLKLRAEETVFIDDRMPNVDGAKRLSMKAFLYEDMPTLQSDLNSLDVAIK